MDEAKQWGLAKRLYTSDQLFVFVKNTCTRLCTNIFSIYTLMYQVFLHTRVYNNVFYVWADLLSVDQAAGRRAGGLLHGRGEGVGPRPRICTPVDQRLTYIHAHIHTPIYQR